ncbi:uncharacterized protein LOC135397714 isoform X2 [Ornithodoros turicata]|uniref:uncharacterized protein LOC135397714 isoform X2 n=1 Tax=Ornithodoros turicata TaxID=34597 RepID=UPI003139549C
MLCDTRQSILAYAGIFSGYYSLLLFLEYNSGDDVTVAKIVNMGSYGISLLMHLLLLLSMATMNRELLGLFITFLKLSVVLLVVLILIDIIMGPKVASSSHRRRRRRRKDATFLDDLSFFWIGDPSDDYGDGNEGDDGDDETLNVTHSLKKAAHVSRAVAVLEIKSVFGFKWNFVNHVIMIILDIFMIWRLSGYYSTMERD